MFVVSHANLSTDVCPIHQPPPCSRVLAVQRKNAGSAWSQAYEDEMRSEYSRGQEVSVILARHLAREVLCGQVELVALGRLLGQLLRLLLKELERVGLVNALALGRRHAVADPLPQLASGHLRGSSVLPDVDILLVSPYIPLKRLLEQSRMSRKEEGLHQVVDRHTSNAADPCFHIAETNVEILANALLGDLSWDVHVQQVVLANLHVLPPDEKLVRRRHILIEDVRGDGCQRGVCYPCTEGIYMLVVFHFSFAGLHTRLSLSERNTNQKGKEGALAILTHHGQRVLHAAYPPSRPPSPCHSLPCRP